MARGKKVTELSKEFFDQVEGWLGFIATDPGVEFDGVDHVDGEDGVEIVAAYGKSKDGNREQYTPAMRAKIEAMVEAKSSAKPPQFQGKEAA